MKFKWIYHDHKELTIFDQIKRNRNIGDDFLKNNYHHLPNPSLMKDLDKAVERIIFALTQKEKIIIFGHDDLDGITSTYILFDFLENVGSQNHYYYIPNRLVDNHGIQDNFIQKVINEDINLVITVDNGITDTKAVEKLNANGKEVIITDHHLVPDQLPPAYAIVNPKQDDCPFPFDMMAGVGIVYFLVKRLSEKMNVPLDMNYLFWVAVGSIADKVPMISLNRILVKKALEEWNNFGDDSFRLLSQQNSSARNHTSRMGLIRFIIRLLSNHRDQNGENRSLKFLIKSTTNKEDFYQKLLKEYNSQEDKLEELKEYLDSLIPEQDLLYLIYFDTKKQIPFEYLGFSASYISNLIRIPVMMLKRKNDVISCEARSTEGFDLVESFHNCRECLIQFGGHKKAAGFTMMSSKYDRFRDCIHKQAQKNEHYICEYRKLNIDAVFDISKIDEYKQFIQTDFDFLQPYGEDNPAPIVILKGFTPALHNNLINIDNISILNGNDYTYDVVLKYNGAGIKILDYKKK